MVSIELPTDVEEHLREVIQKSYNGDLELAMTAFLRLHEKYGWKEQLRTDIEAVRSEVRRRGGISSAKIDGAIQRYRRREERSDG